MDSESAKSILRAKLYLLEEGDWIDKGVGIPVIEKKIVDTFLNIN